jgi:hypothetical protein
MIRSRETLLFTELWRVFPFLLALLLVGCGESDEIRRYRAPKAAVVSTPAEPPAAHSPLDASFPQRMLGAIIPIEGSAWFFRMNGDPEQLQPHVATFKQWLQSIRFENAQPRWELPDQWRMMPASGMRFATILPDPQRDDVELTVIPLPIDGDREQAILANINRWRSQLSLSPIDQSQLSATTEAIPLEGLTAIFVDLISENRSGGDAGQASGRTEPQLKPGGAAPGGNRLEFETPEGWQPAPLVISRGGITIRHEAAFEITNGEQRLEFTLDRLPAAGSLLQNVNRWRNQIGLEQIGAQELTQATRKVEVGGVTADFVELIGDQEAILGVIVVRDDLAWYFKLRGDKELAAREKEKFLSLAQSVKFP